MFKALVTGGAGFIGSFLCEALVDKGYKVTCIDNLITGSLANLESLKNHDCFKFIKGDVTQKSDISEKYDYIYHLASPASVSDYQKYPIETALVNSVGTRNMLDLAKDVGAKFLFASTSEVYGDPKEHPQKESYWGNVNPNGERACYDESKRFGEALTMEYFRKYKVNTRIIRIFNTYGPRMRPNDGRVISNFVNQALTGEPITVYGDGDQTRSFCYVDDMVRGIVLSMEKSGTNGEVFNLGNPDEYKMLDLAKKIKEETYSKSEIIFTDLPIDDPTRRKPDIGKAKKIFSWEPEVDFKKGIKKTISYYQALL